MFLNTREVVERLNMPRTTLYRLVEAGTIRAYKMGGLYKFDESDVADFIRDSRVRPAATIRTKRRKPTQPNVGKYYPGKRLV